MQYELWRVKVKILFFFFGRAYMCNYYQKTLERTLTYIFTIAIGSCTRRTWRQQQRRDGTWIIQYIWLCVDVCLGYRGRGAGVELTQNSSRQSGGGWQWLWESSAGGRGRRTAVSQSRDWWVRCVIWGGWGERLKFHSLFTLGCSQWRQLFEGANLEVTPPPAPVLWLRGTCAAEKRFPHLPTHPYTCPLNLQCNPPTQHIQDCMQSINKLGCSNLRGAPTSLLTSKFPNCGPGTKRGHEGAFRWTFSAFFFQS